MTKLLLNIFYITTLIFASCSRSPSSVDKLHDKLNIFVSISPQKFLTEFIGGKYVNVSVMVPPGMDPHEYDPTPEKIMLLSKAQYYITIGVPFEDVLLSKISSINPKLKFIDSIVGINRIYMTEDNKKAIDPHVWLSLKLDIKIAKNICNALIIADPLHREYYVHNTSDIINRLESINEQITNELKPFKGKTFIVFHPAFGYFAKDYGLIQSPIEMDGKIPPPKQLVNTIKSAEKERIKVVFVEPQFDATAAKTLATSIRAKVEVIDPADENIISSMTDIAQKLKASFQ